MTTIRTEIRLFNDASMIDIEDDMRHHSHKMASDYIGQNGEQYHRPDEIKWKLALRCVLTSSEYHRMHKRANWFHDNSSTDISSTTLRLQTFRRQTFRLLLYTSV